MQHDTIAAISTAMGEAAISVVRISGPRALEIGVRMFQLRADTVPRRAHLVHACDLDDRTLDHGLVLYFKAPASYTGEDVIEFHGHGGVLVTQSVLESVLACGARAAEPGEFTQRAFLNGKMDLTQAEAVMDLIQAQSALALRAANEQLAGAIGHEAHAMQQAIVPVLAHVEAYIDFPEEDISPETGADLTRRLDAVLDRARSLIATAEHGRILRHGARTVISGAPNVGKSSLLNLLLGFERAIVSPTPGTTRDTIEDFIHVHGYALRLVDTAGVRHATDEIEKVGIQRTARELERADLIIEVVDTTQPPTAERINEPRDAAIPRSSSLNLNASQAACRILVLNKADLGVHPGWNAIQEVIPLSCMTGEGVQRLRDAIREVLSRGAAAAADHPVAINARHKAAFERTEQSLQAARTALERNDPPELIAFEIREALHAIGDVIGQVDVERVLDVIFSTFCIGK